MNTETAARAMKLSTRFFESGLAHNSDFAANEENVDWIARQFPKMLRAFREAKVI